jgi:flagellar M-ring protein FliF
MNERLTKVKTDSRNFWTSRTKNQKGVMIGGLVLVIALASVITYFSTRTTMVPVFTDLSMSEVAQIKEVLDAQGTPYELAPGGTNILVPEDQVDAVTVSLVSQGYPSSGGITSAFFAENAGFGTTENEFNLLKNAAAETELANLLKQIEGVKSASVRITVPEKGVFINDQAQPSTAAVLLNTNPGHKFTDEQILTLYNLVAKSVPNLTVDNITISNQHSEYYDLNAATAGTSGNSVHTAEGQMAIKKTIERDLQRQVQNMLSMMVGQDKVAVTVTTSIDFKQENREENLVEPVDAENMEGIAISAQSIIETYTGNGAASGTPEAGNPTDNLVDYVEGTNSNGDYERIEETINNEVNRIRKEILESPYKVKNIGIQAMVEPPEGDDQEAVRGEIERMLAAVVRTSLDAETANTLTDDQIANNIVVSVQPLYGSPANGEEPNSIIPWWLWVIGGILVAAIALLVFFILRSKKSKRIEEEEIIIEEQKELFVEDISEEKETESTIRRKQLEKMAKEKPDDFAKLLRSWIAED